MQPVTKASARIVPRTAERTFYRAKKWARFHSMERRLWDHSKLSRFGIEDVKYSIKVSETSEFLQWPAWRKKDFIRPLLIYLPYIFRLPQAMKEIGEVCTQAIC